MASTNVVASSLELKVIEWLTKRQIHFNFQTVLMGGHFALGGAIVDFLFPDRMLAWRVQGGFWHQGVTKTGSDQIQRELLTAMGYVVVDIWEDDLEPDRIDYTLELALEGQEVPH